LLPSKLLTVSLSVLGSAPRPLKNRMRVKLHLGTAELVASVRLLGRDSIEPGESCPAQLFLSEPTVSVWNQPFVVRFESPAATIGGGRVLDPNAERIRRAEPEILEMISHLASQDTVERASAALYFAGLRDWQPADLARTAGIDSFGDVAERLRERGDLREIVISPTRKVRLHRLVLARLYNRIETALKKLHDQFPLRTTHDRAALAAGFSYLADDAILTTALKDMQTAGRISFGPRGVSLAGHGPKLSPNEQRVLTQLVEIFRNAGMQPPSVKECQQQAMKHQSAVPQLLSLGVANGELVDVGPDFFLHTDVDVQARQLLATRFAGSPGLTVSEIREILNTSRKYAVPYCEYLDRIGFTERRGNYRVLAKH
jgi:selenocysteine-specific elongation factor